MKKNSVKIIIIDEFSNTKTSSLVNSLCEKNYNNRVTQMTFVYEKNMMTFLYEHFIVDEFSIRVDQCWWIFYHKRSYFMIIVYMERSSLMICLYEFTHRSSLISLVFFQWNDLFENIIVNKFSSQNLFVGNFPIQNNHCLWSFFKTRSSLNTFL